MHRIVKQVLDQFPREHGLEVAVIVGEAIALAVEQVDLQLESLAAHARSFPRGLAERAVIGSAHLPVTAQLLQKGSDVHVAAEFQNAAARARTRHQGDRTCQTRQMLFEIRAGIGVRQIEVAQPCDDGAQFCGRFWSRYWSSMACPWYWRATTISTNA